MAGPYCRFCDRRCFVYRILPDRSWAGMMATCAEGMAYDRGALRHDHTTAVNPVLVTWLLDGIVAVSGLDRGQARATLHSVLYTLTTRPLDSAMLESYAAFLNAEGIDHAHAQHPSGRTVQ